MNINEMMKNAKRLQDELAKETEKLYAKEFKVEKHGIIVVMLGSRRLKSVIIDPALVDPEEPELIGDLVILAVNEVLEIIDEEQEALNAKFTPAGF